MAFTDPRIMKVQINASKNARKRTRVFQLTHETKRNVTKHRKNNTQCHITYEKIKFIKWPNIFEQI